MINIDDLITEINSFKNILITGNPVLIELFSKSPEELAKDYNKKEFYPIADLLGVKKTGKEVDLIKELIKTFNNLL